MNVAHHVQRHGSKDAGCGTPLAPRGLLRREGGREETEVLASRNYPGDSERMSRQQTRLGTPGACWLQDQVSQMPWVWDQIQRVAWRGGPSSVMTSWAYMPHSVPCAVLICFSHVWLFATLWTGSHQAPLSKGFSRQEYWSGLLCPPLGDLPDPGIEPTSPALVGRFFTTSIIWEAPFCSLHTSIPRAGC